MKHAYYICPICEKHRFTVSGDFDICPHCGWENDAVMNDDPTFFGGANDLCQLDYKLRYNCYLRIKPEYHWAHDHHMKFPQVEEMLCPVCGKMRFTPLRWDEIYQNITPSDVYCQYCGWHYDHEQNESPDLKNRANSMSLNEYKEWYIKKLFDNPDYCYFDEVTDNYIPVPHKCPVCGKYEFEDESCYDVCPFCGWEDDGVQMNDADCEGGANVLSLNQYRKQYQQRLKDNPNYKWKTGKM